MGESKPVRQTNSVYTPSKVYGDELDKRIADELWGNGHTVINGNPDSSTTIEETPKDIREPLDKYIADEVSRQLESVKVRERLMDMMVAVIEANRYE